MARHSEHRGTQFIALAHPDQELQRDNTVAPGEIALVSTELPLDVEANEVVVSWNARAPEGTGLKMECRAFYTDHATAWYTMGQWSPDGVTRQRASVNGQNDSDGRVNTDTLVLARPANRVQVRVTLESSSTGEKPEIKLIGVCATDGHDVEQPLPPRQEVWGKEIVVPSKAQYGYPDQSGWCSPTSVSMVLALWAKRLDRPELDMPVPTVAHAIYDSVYDGTGNWPFNTAFAGSFHDIRAYVTRLSDISELEAWVPSGIPPIVSLSYDLLLGKERDNDPGHLMVCDGFTANGDIVLNDPAHHPDRGQAARRIFPRASFIKAWKRSKNLVYLIYPVDAETPPDPYGHWMHGKS